MYKLYGFFLVIGNQANKSEMDGMNEQNVRKIEFPTVYLTTGYDVVEKNLKCITQSNKRNKNQFNS